jgi:ribosomal protein S18 acetylase RimI-like enzyme
MIQKNKLISKSIEKLISIHRNEKNFKIITLLYEALYEIESEKNTFYFFIYKDNEIITSSRLIIDKKKNGYMNMVHTNKNFRNLGFCKENIYKFLNLMKDCCKKIILHVEKNNISAIKCYLSVGFYYKKIKNNQSDLFTMIYLY